MPSGTFSVLPRGRSMIASQAPLRNLQSISTSRRGASRPRTHADVQLPMGHVRPVSDFFVTVAETGARKSASDSETLAPLDLDGYALDRPASDLALRIGGEGMTLHSYWTSKCAECPLKTRCTTGKERRIKRWEHEVVIDAMQDRLDRAPKSMRVRRATVEHPLGTLKAWMGATHFKTRTLEKVRTEMSLHVLAYNLKRVIAILGAQPLMEAMRA